MSGLGEAVFREAIASVPQGVLVCDRAGAILFANPAAELTFGYGGGELLGLAVAQVLPDGRIDFDPASLQPQTARAMPGLRKDGSGIRVGVGFTLVHNDDGSAVVVATINDLAHVAGDVQPFERLVSSVASRFVNLALEDVNETVVDCLKVVGEALDLDRCTVWILSADAGPTVVHSWTRSEYPVLPLGSSAREDIPWTSERLMAGEAVVFSRREELPSKTDREAFERLGTQSSLFLAFAVAGDVRGGVSFSTVRQARDWPPETITRLQLVSSILGQALARKESEERLRKALSDVRDLRDELAIENLQIRREVRVHLSPRLVIAESPSTRHVLEQIESVARTPATVLLLGETGSGKEVFAHAIHRASERRDRPMVLVNCAAIPGTLIESELFGRERGAYTGALARQAGRFELAQGSTIFLDEIGDLPLEAQVKLLRVLQDKVVERLGSGQPIKVDVRIIAATNRDLEKAVADHTFREDLYYRLNVFPIAVPPLRERPEDIPALVWTFVEEFSKSFGKRIESISRDSLAALQRYSWPGNVRELRNMVERAVILASGPRLVIESSKLAMASAPSRSTRLMDLEVEHIVRVLEGTQWRVRGSGGAAELLGVKPTTLDSRMAKLGIRRPAK
jgi:PAS domain S-box-containing protein